MSRLRFGLDLDGVIYDWHSSARFLLNWHRGPGNQLPPVEKMWSRWEGHKDYISEEDEDWLWTKGVERGLFRHGHVRKGAIEFCQEIDKLADIVIITHRPKQARQDTLDWLAFHRIPTSEIHMLHAETNKAGIPVDLALDDKPENVMDFWGKGVPALLWDRPWNQDTAIAGNKEAMDHYRVRDWGSVLLWAEDRKAVKTIMGSFASI